MPSGRGAETRRPGVKRLRPWPVPCLLRPVSLDPIDAAHAAGLRYVSDAEPGIRRRKSGKSFAYEDADGRPVRDSEMLARIKSLVIPPAWTDVWICADACGHLQATGRDARGRKQYRYHPAGAPSATRRSTSACSPSAGRCRGSAPRSSAICARPGLPREKVLAAVVRLLELTLGPGRQRGVRAREPLLRPDDAARPPRHDLGRDACAFQVPRQERKAPPTIDLRDSRLARIVGAARSCPARSCSSTWTTAARRARSNPPTSTRTSARRAARICTAKDFRTWAGTLLAAHGLAACEASETAAAAEAQRRGGRRGMSRSASATRRRSVASATSTRP